MAVAEQHGRRVRRHREHRHPTTTGRGSGRSSSRARALTWRHLLSPGPDAGSRWHPGGMQSVYEAAGGDEGMLRLAEAWHARVMADEVVSHAFSHGFHPQHSERLAAYWAE